MDLHNCKVKLPPFMLRQDLKSLDEKSTLEMLLCYVMPAYSVSWYTEKLMDTFGGFSGVFDASIEELCSMGGLSLESAKLIVLIFWICKKYHISKISNIVDIPDIETAGTYLKPYFSYLTKEVLYLLCLDQANHLTGCIDLEKGSEHSVPLNMRKILEYAFRKHASSVIMAHNHPSGRLIPSNEDESMTKYALELFHKVDIVLVDHLIFAGDQYFSMSKNGYFI